MEPEKKPLFPEGRNAHRERSIRRMLKRRLKAAGPPGIYAERGLQVTGATDLLD